MRAILFSLSIAVVFCGMAGQVSGQKSSTVDARQSGPWSVGIDQANNGVRVTNSPTDPVNVKVVPNGPAKRPFQLAAGADINPGGSGATVFLPVPVGKRLVIESVSAYAFRPPGLKMSIDFLTNFDNGEGIDNNQNFFIPQSVVLSEQGTVLSGDEIATANHRVLAFADERVGTSANLSIRISIRLSGTVPFNRFARGVVTFTGYMEDLPSNQ